MRLALIITTNYDDNPRLETHRAASLDSALMAEQLLSAEPEFSVEKLEADRDLPERLEALLEQYPDELEALTVYFSGYVALSRERGPALLLSGARIKAYPVSRLRALLQRCGVDALCILDVAAMVEGTRWPSDIAGELASTLASPKAGLSALVAVRLLASRAPLGVSRFTDLFALVLDWLGRHGNGPIHAHDVYEAMKREKASFAQVAASAYVGAENRFPLAIGTSVLGEQSTEAPTPPDPDERMDGAPQSRHELAYLPSAPPGILAAARASRSAPAPAATAVPPSAPPSAPPSPSHAEPEPAATRPNEGIPQPGLGWALPPPNSADDANAPLPHFPMGLDEEEYAAMPSGDLSAEPMPARRKLETLPGIQPREQGEQAERSSDATRAPSSLVPWPSSPPAPGARRASPSLEPPPLYKRRRAVLAPPSLPPGPSAPPTGSAPSNEDDDDAPTPWPPTSQPAFATATETGATVPTSAAQFEPSQRTPESLPDNEQRRALPFIRSGDALRAEGRAADAIAQYRQALALDSAARPAFDGLTVLLVEQGAIDEAIALYRERLNNVYDKDETVSLLDRLVCVWLDKRGDTTEALKTLEERLAFRADQQGLRLLVKIHELRHDLDSALAAREELAAVLPDPAEQVDMLIDAAHQAEVELGDLSRAARLAKKAFERDPSNPVALEFAASVLKSLNDFAGVADLYEQALAIEPLPEVGLRLMSNLISVYREQLRDPERAARTARKAIRLAPSRADLRIVLADAYEKQGLLDEALDQARAAAMIAPEIPATYRVARHILQHAGNLDGAYAAAGIASWLDPNDTESARFAGAYDSGSLLVAERTLTDEDWELLAAEVNPSLLVALDAIHDAVVTLRVKSRNRKPIELDPSMRHNPEKSTATVARSVHWAGRLLRISLPAVYILPDLEEPLVVARTEQPSLLFGRELASGHTLPELAFLSGRHLTLFRREYYLHALFRDARKLALPLRGALTLASGRTSNREEVRNMAKRLQRLLQDNDLEQLREATELLDADIDRLLEEWMAAVQRTAIRAGLLACGHPQTAGPLLERYPLRGALAPEQQTEALILFALSDQYAELRRRLGVRLSETQQDAG